jgi:ribose transport system permease protein
MTAPPPAEAAAIPQPPRSTVKSGSPIQPRFLAIWIGMLVLIAFCAVVVPRSLLPSTFLAIIPLGAFLAISAIGEALVIMSRGIDLSLPAVITLSSTVILGVSAGRDANLLPAIVGALLFAILIGAANGVLVAVFNLNALIVTLAVGAITSGATLWYRDSLPAESRVPPLMAEWGDARLFGLNLSVWVAAALVIVLTVVLQKNADGATFLRRRRETPRRLDSWRQDLFL